MAIARMGLGSNVGDTRANIEAAFAELASLGEVRARSSLYVSRAWGVTDQPDFLNAAALLVTLLDPFELLRGLKDIEQRLGRVATYRWGPRAIDLDILAYDDLVVDTADLTLPHPRLHERAFALVPLAEIDPTYEQQLMCLDAAARGEVRRFDGIAD